MTDLVRTLLARRPYVSEGTLIDCLELADWLDMRIRAGIVPKITTAEMMSRWQCSQSTVSRRIAALREHQLLEVTDHPGPGAYWAVYRVGPAP